MAAWEFIVVVALLLVAIAGYLYVRARQPEPPPNANRGGGEGDHDDHLEAVADEDPVPRQADGTPLPGQTVENRPGRAGPD